MSCVWLLRDKFREPKLEGMKANRCELAMLFLLCAALPLWAVAAELLKPLLNVRCKAEPLRPEPGWKETDTRVTTAMQTTDKGIVARVQAKRYYYGVGGRAYRWYYNSRIEGFYQGQKQILYSTEADKFHCWYASSNNSIDWNKHELREWFALRKLPVKATGLTYTIEAVAFKSTYAAGAPVRQRQIDQMRHWKNFAGYASYSIPLKRKPRSK